MHVWVSEHFDLKKLSSVRIISDNPRSSVIKIFIQDLNVTSYK